VDAPPILNIVVSGNNVVVTWPLTCTPFRLQQTPSLKPATWTDTAPPTVVNNHNQVTIPLGAGPMFFRLIYP
jgi:hypothetical protein